MSGAKVRLPSLSALSQIGTVARHGARGPGPLVLPMENIEEDPDQPRTYFDPAKLEELAASIRARGVLQPIGVKKTRTPIHRIVYGARRFRAARMAALQVIPVVLVPEHVATLDAQMIENLHRDDFRNSELIAGIARMSRDGKSRKEIADLFGWDADRVKLFLNLEGAPAFIMAVVDGIAVRAAYDLFQAWKKAPAAIEQAVHGRDELTYPEVRAIVAQALGTSKKPTAGHQLVHGAPETEPSPRSDDPMAVHRAPDMLAPSAVEETEPVHGAPPEEPVAARPTPVHDAPEKGATARPVVPAAPRPANPQRDAMMRAQIGPARVIVADASRTGTLMTARVAGEGHVFVAFDDGEQEIAVTELRLIGIVREAD